MAVGNYQCNAANLTQSKAQVQLELSLAQFSPSLLAYFLVPIIFWTQILIIMIYLCTKES